MQSTSFSELTDEIISATGEIGPQLYQNVMNFNKKVFFLLKCKCHNKYFGCQ